MESDRSTVRKLVILSGIFFALYVLGQLFSETFWGTHFAAFLPRELRWPILLVSAILIAFPLIYTIPEHTFHPKGKKTVSPIQLLVFCLFLALLFFAFPIYEDSYGDASFIIPNLQKTVQDWASPLIENLLYFNPLDSKMGMSSSYALTNFLSYLTGLKADICLRIWGIISGLIYLLLWGNLVRRYIKGVYAQWFFILLGSFAPFTQMFYGHYEIYVFSMPALMAYLSMLAAYFQQPHTRKRIYLFLLFLLCLKFHVTAYLLLPSLMLVLLDSFRDTYPQIVQLFTWKNIRNWVLIPGLVLGALLYFFVTKSHYSSRDFTSETILNVLFLPILATDPPPLDSYNLLSFNHILDYVNMSFIWSSAVMFLLLAASLFFRRYSRWDNPLKAITGLTLISYLVAFFFLNPLLSMPIDWDLFSLIAPILLFMCLLLFGEEELSKKLRLLAMPALGFILLGSTFMMVNARPHSLSSRLESNGKHIAKTYWKGYSTAIYNALAIEPKQPIREERLNSILEELRPWAINGNDDEYADLLCEKGKLSMDRSAVEEAIGYFEEAHLYSPMLRRNSYQLVEAYYLAGNYEKAFQYLQLMLELVYPSEEVALAIAIEVAVFAEKPADALAYCERYLELVPDSKFFLEIFQILSHQKEPIKRAIQHFHANR